MTPSSTSKGCDSPCVLHINLFFVMQMIVNCLFVSTSIDGQDSGDTKQSTADMTQFVQTLLQQMIFYFILTSPVMQQSRFQTMSDSIMGDRINELEQSINDLRTEMGVEGSPSPLSTSKKPDEPKTEEAVGVLVEVYWLAELVFGKMVEDG
ncbi:hypothetical protein R6Q59_017310 [Mikania micrantha]